MELRGICMLYARLRYGPPARSNPILHNRIASLRLK